MTVCGYFALGIQSAFAKRPADEPGFSFESVKHALDPVSNAFASLIWGLISFWNYLIQHPPAAVILSALMAATLAGIGIHMQRKMTRLRETFATVNNDNWDEDVIKARSAFSNLRKNLDGKPHEIAKFCNPATDDDRATAQILQTIMNDYENLALGVRLNIVDEDFLYRWMRGVLIRDWSSLSPLVTAYRQKFNNTEIYIEFEGIALAWQQNRSYRTKRGMRRAKKTTSIR